jgi:hypothetical protein
MFHLANRFIIFTQIYQNCIAVVFTYFYKEGFGKSVKTINLLASNTVTTKNNKKISVPTYTKITKDPIVFVFINKTEKKFQEKIKTRNTQRCKGN